MRNITIGQYYPADSILHKLDPRVKFLGTLVFIVSLFLIKGLAGYVFVTVVLATLVKLSKVPFGMMLKGMKAIIFILIITVIFNMLFTPGEAIFTIWRLSVTKEGAVQAFRMAIRLSYLIIGSSIMTLTTTPNQLTDAMENLFSPLKVIKVPVHEISMMMSIALRFIPILMEETDKIMKAQIARGADFESGNLIKRVTNMIPLLVPLFVSAFQRANDLAMAMEARCYHGGEGRTQMKPLRYEKRDYIAYILMLAFAAAAVCFCIFGGGWI
ncbi:MAG: energy-coupling factor transporter transmembrane protein EcfT [Lachnospiraceae bacterium]|nr:energy-coupling factor transporter transmembrane protein EcfT [Lachnospiraceae bacterium]